MENIILMISIQIQIIIQLQERKSNLKGMDSIASFLYNELRK